MPKRKPKVETLVIELPPVPITYWQKTKAWFKYSESIFLARTEVAVGFVVTAISAFDWSPLLSMDFGTGFSSKQAGILGGIMVTKGVFSEWARRRNAVELQGPPPVIVQ